MHIYAKNIFANSSGINSTNGTIGGGVSGEAFQKSDVPSLKEDIKKDFSRDYFDKKTVLTVIVSVVITGATTLLSLATFALDLYSSLSSKIESANTRLDSVQDRVINLNKEILDLKSNQTKK